MSTALDRFFERERRLYGRAEYRFKDEYVHERVIAFYIRLFNPTYLYQYTTTEYPHTYFPRRKAADEQSMLETEYHENVHKWDRWNQGPRFSLGYAFPQIVAAPFILAAVAVSGVWGWLGLGALLAALHLGLGLLALTTGKGDPADNYAGAVPPTWARVTSIVLGGSGAAACVAGTIVGGGVLALLWVPAALFLSPWPIKSCWRRDAELRGYTASLYRFWLRNRGQWSDQWAEELISHYTKAFTGPAYFYMETNGQRVADEFRWQMRRWQKDNRSFLECWGWKDRQLGFDYGRGCKQAESFRMMHEHMVDEGMINGS